MELETKEKTDIKSLTYEQLEEYMLSRGEKKYRAGQLFEWMHKHLASSIDEMANLPKTLRESLKEECVYTAAKVEKRQSSKADGTQKFLFSMADGQMIESVFMPYQHGNSVCISSQAGCRMGCAFCASAIGGLVRNLTPAEMLEQIYEITRQTGERVSNIVVMGTGEPLDNYVNLLTFINLVSHEKGLNISRRNITVSTCGLVDKIGQLAEENLPITLAISLHAVTDEKRRELMPIARRYSIDELLTAAGAYGKKTGRRVTLEYSLIAGKNDTKEDAQLLAAHAKRIGAHVNLIPVNPVTETGLQPPDLKAVERFSDRLEKEHANVTVRRRLGADIDAACGQLVRKG